MNGHRTDEATYRTVVQESLLGERKLAIGKQRQGVPGKERTLEVTFVF